MGLFSRLKKHNSKPKEASEFELDEVLDEVFAQQEPDSSEVSAENLKKQLQSKEMTLEDYCNQLVLSTKQLDKRKIEYEQVTAYLTDIQMLDHMTEEEQQKVNELAAKLVILTGDREELKQDTKKLTDIQFRFMQLHEHEIQDGIRSMEEQEKYQTEIRSDLQKLQEEKTNLKKEEKYYLQKMYNLKMTTVSLVFLAVIASGLILFLYTQYIFDLPFSLLIVFFVLAIAGSIIYLKYRNVNYALAYCRKQQERAVKLLNKVKIKQVNNASTLDYLCQKYNVGSARELAYLWEQYGQILENEELYKRSSKELSRYGDELVRILKKVGLHDADIWTYQAIALVDSRELVEVTHNLNARRQKLREDMQVQEDILDIAINGIQDMLKKNPEKTDEVKQLLQSYKIAI